MAQSNAEWHQQDDHLPPYPLAYFKVGLSVITDPREVLRTTKSQVDQIK